MAKVLSISSQVVSGHVGNSSTAFVLQRMGHEVLSLPTVLLSNRPGYNAIAGGPIDAAKLDAVMTAILQNGWLNNVNAILTGYVPTPEHAAVCERWIRRVQSLNAQAIYLCDPILGDEPAGLYVKEPAAAAIRDQLVPLAGIVTPNRFEASWLSGRTISDVGAAVSAARILQPRTVLVTSAPAHTPGHLANILVKKRGAVATVCPREIVHARGTGDFFAATFLGRLLNGCDEALALRAATGAMTVVLAASGDSAELKLIETQASWAAENPVLAPLTDFPGLSDPL